MKARIDTKAKTLAIEDPVSMDDLLKFVKFVAGDEWKSWKVETNVKFEITSSPIIIRDYSRPWTQPYWYRDAITSVDGATVSVPSGQSINSNVAYLDFQPTNN